MPISKEQSRIFVERLRAIRADARMELLEKYRLLKKELLLFCQDELWDGDLPGDDFTYIVRVLGSLYPSNGRLSACLQLMRKDIEQVLRCEAEPVERVFDKELALLEQLAACVDGGTLNLDEAFQGLEESLGGDLRILPSPFVKRMRCEFVGMDGEWMLVRLADYPLAGERKVSFRNDTCDDTFAHTVSLLRRGDALNLLNVRVEKNGLCHAEIIVYQPDFLMDVSVLADCMRDYGCSPANYHLRNLVLLGNRMPLIVGNIVNMFLDEWIYSAAPPSYAECMRKAFRKMALDIISCADIERDEKAFFHKCRLHFDHIRQVVEQILSDRRRFDIDDAVLEPAYICEPLGLQGRLDYMQRDASSFIEMKSGKADEYSVRGKIEAPLPNKTQMMLYLAMLDFCLGKDHRRIHPYLLYTLYPHLYTATPSWNVVRRAIDARNRIVSEVCASQRGKGVVRTAAILNGIVPDKMNERRMRGKLWSDYLRPGIEAFSVSIGRLSPLEKSYYLSLHKFITSELCAAKIGAGEGRRDNFASIWSLSDVEKEERGIIMQGLRIKTNDIAAAHAPHMIFSFPEAGEQCVVLNFRQGDSVIVYEKNSPSDTACNRMVFKGNIERITPSDVEVRFRSPQKNAKIINSSATFAIEPDYNDKPTLNMYQSLPHFCAAHPVRRDLLVGNRLPSFDGDLLAAVAEQANDFERIAYKVRAAYDYMLVVGPPGTGKTSRALKRMVETLLEEGKGNILLLSYTNRAVDEICKCLSALSPKTDYIRLGNEITCDECYRPNLMENRLERCANRADAREVIERCRIFVSTVVTLQNNMEIFNIKSFDCAIIDEATQILEPQILGILSAKDRAGNDAVRRFVLIGDDKQLPAVTVSSDQKAAIDAPGLVELGFRSFKESLFERLRRLCLRRCPQAVDMLRRQGRMHPDIADFVNRNFYAGKLLTLGLPHQVEQAVECVAPPMPGVDAVSLMRLAFVSHRADASSLNEKTNVGEARVACEIALRIYARTKECFDPMRTLGIIAPYKSQIALIKQELAKLGIGSLNRITIDTVERYQGSERDVIIFSCCASRPYQVRLMSSLVREDGVVVDRKFNVALTRARKQVFVIGDERVLCGERTYKLFVDYAKAHGCFVSLDASEA